MATDPGPAVTVRPAGPVAEVWLERPGSLNALGPEVLEGLVAAVEAATAAGCSVLVLRGRGAALSAGADLGHLRSLLPDPVAVDAYIAAIGRAVDAVEQAPLITLCVVDGYALAGGWELLLACDLVVATSDARIGDRHLEYGLLPGAGGSVRGSRALPPALARRLLYTGEIIDGDTAAAWGLVGWSVPASELDATVDGIVARLARHSPAALRAMKRMHTDAVSAADGALRAALDGERTALVDHLVHEPDAAEGLAAFAERRPPDFRRDPGSGSTAP
jgi:enoyl-CoA hydratase